MSTIFIEEVFKLLATNLKYPYYQGERRIDIFINLFLNDIIQQKTIFKNAEYLVPEFPLKKSEKSDHAAHIDYLMFSSKYQGPVSGDSNGTVLLVELKTDDGSYLDEQIKYYLGHPEFSKLYEQFSKIKLKKHTDKKDVLYKRLEILTKHDMKDFKIAVVVLKPSITEKDLKNAEEFNGRLHFVALTDLKIETRFQEEWELFREQVLMNLRTKEKKNNHFLKSKNS